MQPLHFLIHVTGGWYAFDDVLDLPICLGWVAGGQGEGGSDAAVRDRHKHAAAVAVRDAPADGDRRVLRFRDPDNGNHTRLVARRDTR